MTTTLIYDWDRFTDYAHRQGFQLTNFGDNSNAVVTQNELDIVTELVDRLVFDAKKCGSGKVDGFPVGWGSSSGGIRLRFENPKTAMLWKLSW